jgi:predicted RNase H-like HicB family nuclease
MSINKDIEYYKKLEYNVILKRKGEDFVLFIPDLNIWSKAENLEKAYAELKEEKVKYIEKMSQEKALHLIVEPQGMNRKKLTNEFALFFIKLGIVSVLIAILCFCCILAGGVFIYKFDEMKSFLSPRTKNKIKLVTSQLADSIKPLFDKPDDKAQNTNGGKNE